MAGERTVLDPGRSTARPARRLTKARTTRPPETVRELCHDLRGPAATIMAIAAAATVEGEMSPALTTRLAQIVDEARRISAMCRDVLEAPAHSAVVSIDELATNVVTPVRIAADVAVELRITPASVLGNPHALGRALWNLVDNAARAAGAGGRLLVEVSEARSMVRVAVSDSGPGFGAAKRGVGGLGLRIAGRVAAEHGGELIVTRHGELGGASVVLVLPSAHGFAMAQPS